LFGAIDAGDWIELWCGLGVLAIGQAINLLHVEHGVAFQVRDYTHLLGVIR